MSRYLKKPASALLTVLLILTALAGIMLLATKSSLQSTRALSRTDNASYARQMAQSGIEEGLARLKKSGAGTVGTNSDMVYGSTTSSIDRSNPTVMRRGFLKTPQAPCSDFMTTAQEATAAPEYDLRCPYYDLAIRNFQTITSVNKENYTITGSDLIIGKSLTLRVDGSGFFRSDGVTFGDVSIKVGDDDPKFIDSGNPVSIPATSMPIKIEIIKNTNSSINFSIMVDPNISVDIERPQLLIESTGYANGVQRKLLFTLARYPQSEMPPSLQDFGASFDKFGFLQ